MRPSLVLVALCVAVSALAASLGSQHTAATLPLEFVVVQAEPAVNEPATLAALEAEASPDTRTPVVRYASGEVADPNDPNTVIINGEAYHPELLKPLARNRVLLGQTFYASGDDEKTVVRYKNGRVVSIERLPR